MVSDRFAAQAIMSISLVSGACALLMATSAMADIANPPVLQDQRGPIVKPVPGLLTGTTQEPGATGTADAHAMASLGRDRLLGFTIKYSDAQLLNPATGMRDKVRLRSYSHNGSDPAAPYIAPTIEARPGDTLRIILDNQLPDDPSCKAHEAMSHDATANPNTPHCFNGTNLHTHGLWVNPAGNSDNVLLSINPGVKFEYEINIPSDHPAGTFWYHPHRHGSTALQVSSGMAGALVIRGDRLPTDSANGDIDVLMGDANRNPPAGTVRERVLVMQQIQYACRTNEPPPDDPNGQPSGDIKYEPGDGNKRYRCDPGDLGAITGYDQFGPGSWPGSGRYTSINGEVLPTFEAVQGEVQRWRMIHAGVRDTIGLQFFPVRSKAALKEMPLLKSADDVETLINNICDTDPAKALPFQLIAADGLTMAAARETTLATFQPGYRWDALVVFPEGSAGESVDYCVIDAAAPADGTVIGGSLSRELLGAVKVRPGTPVKDIRTHVANVLAANAAASAMEPRLKQAVMGDLADGLKFSHFVPHPDIEASEVTGTQELTFLIGAVPGHDGVSFAVGNTLNSADVQPYDANRIDRKLTLGEVDEWTMQSRVASHPFHIHVNPFQIVSITDPNGKDVSLPDAIDDGGNDGGAADPQYAGLKGVWKDTLWIKHVGGDPNAGIYTIKVRTRYQRYVGDFVLHCHILDHEDQGMMQNISIVLP